MAMRVRWRGFELPTRISVEEETRSDTYAKFTTEPFQRGFGIGQSILATAIFPQVFRKLWKTTFSESAGPVGTRGAGESSTESCRGEDADGETGETATGAARLVRARRAGSSLAAARGAQPPGASLRSWWCP